MDPILNPFAPGAGTPPPELAGRDEIIKEIQFSYKRALIGNPCRSFLLLGLRGVGKTVLLNEIAKLASQDNLIVSEIEAPEEASLAKLLYPVMGKALRSCSVTETAKNIVGKGLKALRNFATGLKIKVDDIELSVDPFPGFADSGNIEYDLPDMFELIGQAAQKAKKAWILLLDEVQYLNEKDFSALIVSLHKISQKGLPIVFVGAGLPQVARLAGTAKSYAKRLFTYPNIGPLPQEAIIQAVKNPLKSQNVTIDDDAMLEIITKTQGYPFFIQALAYNIWNNAKGLNINIDDVKKAFEITLKSLDEGFFKVRFERISPKETQFVEKMAILGKGPYLYSHITDLLEGETKSWSPVRSSLIKKGMIFSPKFKYLDFTVPLFSDYVNRALNRREN